jgi:hypothetical protein
MPLGRKTQGGLIQPSLFTLANFRVSIEPREFPICIVFCRKKNHRIDMPSTVILYCHVESSCHNRASPPTRSFAISYKHASVA